MCQTDQPWGEVLYIDKDLCRGEARLWGWCTMCQTDQPWGEVPYIDKDLCRGETRLWDWCTMCQTDQPWGKFLALIKTCAEVRPGYGVDAQCARLINLGGSSLHWLRPVQMWGQAMGLMHNVPDWSTLGKVPCIDIDLCRGETKLWGWCTMCQTDQPWGKFLALIKTCAEVRPGYGVDAQCARLINLGGSSLHWLRPVQRWDQAMGLMHNVPDWSTLGEVPCID